MTMKTELLIRLNPAFDLASGHFNLEWIWVNRDMTLADEGGLHQGSLGDLASWRESLSVDDFDLPVTLLVPGALAGCHRLHVNEKQRKHWQQALPYLLEEQLASDIESLHIVSSLDDGSDASTASACCITHKDMEKLLRRFTDAGADPVKVLPEAQFFESPESRLTIWLEGDFALLASPGAYGQMLDVEAASVMLPSLLDDGLGAEAEDSLLNPEGDAEGEESSEPEVIVSGLLIEGSADNHAQIESLASLAVEGVPVESRERESASLLVSILPQIAERAKRRQLLDLRSGSYKCTRRASRRWKQWRPLAIVAGLWLGLEVIFNLGSGYYYQYRADQLFDENLAIYKELRPDDRRVVDVRHSLTKFLREANSQQNTGVFLDLLQAMSRVSAGEAGKDVTPKVMDFNESNGRVSLDVQAGSFDKLNRFLDELKDAGLNASMENGNQDAQGVTARLIVRKA